jgi:ATP-dependent Clp protease ATP-binding subunit ClpA
VDVRLNEIQKRLEANDKKITIDATDEVRDYLGAAGYSPAYGARPLQRLIEKEILNRLAVLLLRGAIKDGEIARVELDDGRVIVLPNHTDSDMEDDEDMIDEDEAMMELEDKGDDKDGSMELYE